MKEKSFHRESARSVNCGEFLGQRFPDFLVHGSLCVSRHFSWHLKAKSKQTKKHPKNWKTSLTKWSGPNSLTVVVHMVSNRCHSFSLKNLKYPVSVHSLGTVGSLESRVTNKRTDKLWIGKVQFEVWQHELARCSWLNVFLCCCFAAWSQKQTK